MIFYSAQLKDIVKRNKVRETILNYMKYCCDAYLLYQIKREDLQGKQILSTNKKYYIADHGIKHSHIRDFLTAAEWN